MIQSRHGFIGRLFLFLLAAGALIYLALTWWPAHNLKTVSGEIEKAVNQELVNAGLHDSLILSIVHTERSLSFLKWVETDRTIDPDSALNLNEIQKRLSQVSAHYYCQLTRQDRADSTILQIGLASVQFQKLIFLKQPLPMVAPVKVSKTPQVAFVIDDVAYESASMDHFSTLGVPLTFAIMPRDRHCRELAEKAKAMGFAIILHLPMEPIDLAHNDPGSAGLYLRMTPDELHSQFEKDVASVPYIVGINNHMGSAFTENESKMSTVMPWVKEKHLFFLDSRTSPHSVVCRVAKHFAVPCHVNETFLDNSDEVLPIEHQLDLVLKLALREHQTIAIGHYRRKHLIEALAHKIPEFRAQGVEIVSLPTFYP